MLRKHLPEWQYSHSGSAERECFCVCLRLSSSQWYMYHLGLQRFSMHVPGFTRELSFLYTLVNDRVVETRIFVLRIFSHLFVHFISICWFESYIDKNIYDNTTILFECSMYTYTYYIDSPPKLGHRSRDVWILKGIGVQKNTDMPPTSTCTWTAPIDVDAYIISMYSPNVRIVMTSGNIIWSAYTQYLLHFWI